MVDGMSLSLKDASDSGSYFVFRSNVGFFKLVFVLIFVIMMFVECRYRNVT